MNLENITKVQTIIDSVVRSENEAREKELQAAKEKIRELNTNAAGLREQVIRLSKFQSLLKCLENITETYTCPNCNGDGGRDDGQGGGGECDYCVGSGFVQKHLLNKWIREHTPKVQTSLNEANKQDEEILPF